MLCVRSTSESPISFVISEIHKDPNRGSFWYYKHSIKDTFIFPQWGNLWAEMQTGDPSDDVSGGFGYRQSYPRCRLLVFWCIEYMNRNSAVMDQKSIRQCKADQARILEQFNTPYYSILVSVNIRVINIAGVWSGEYVVLWTSGSHVLGDCFWVFYY